MPKPTTLKWTKLSIWPGDGAAPTESFARKVCGMTAKGFSIALQTSDQVVPDCDNPDDPAWIERVGRSLSGSFSGSGLMAEENFSFYSAWSLSGAAKNVRVVVDMVGTPGYYQGSFLLTKFDLTATESDGKVQVSLAFDSDGAVTYNPGSP